MSYPSFASKYSGYNDLALRICCLRELFEETSILPAYKNGEFTLINNKSMSNSSHSTDNFALLCQDLGN